MRGRGPGHPGTRPLGPSGGPTGERSVPLGSALGLPPLVPQGGTNLAPSRTRPLGHRPLESAEGLPPTVTRGSTGLASRRARALGAAHALPLMSIPHHQRGAGGSQIHGALHIWVCMHLHLPGVQEPHRDLERPHFRVAPKTLGDCTPRPPWRYARTSKRFEPLWGSAHMP